MYMLVYTNKIKFKLNSDVKLNLLNGEIWLNIPELPLLLLLIWSTGAREATRLVLFETSYFDEDQLYKERK